MAVGRLLPLAVVAALLGVGCGDSPAPSERGAGTSSATTAHTATVLPSTTSSTTSSIPPSALPPAPSVATGPASIPPGDGTTVERVVDGDTIVTGLGRVRLIGVDTPETVDPRRPVGCFGHEASANTAALLPPGTKVRLVYDVERRDRYGRLLAYVYRLDDGLFVNARILADGFASILTIPPNVAHADEFLELQRRAREAGRGLWSACEGSAASGGAPTSAPVASRGCDPAYPDVCVPSPPPDLDCADVSARSFRVLAPDPHRFDGNGDGVGCEG
jgi:micrococcal nuclease